jgi:L-ascorbate 6-phosphate lactonase
MTDLAHRIETTVVAPGTLALFWLCQAGFAFKTSSGRVVYIDPYFSDVVERKFGFKRMMKCPIAVEQVVADLVVCTHEHLDHMDTDALPALASNPRMHFAGPVECSKTFESVGIPPDRRHLLAAGESPTIQGVGVHGVFADHLPHAPDAIGVVLDFDGIRVYHTGDTAYRPQQFQPALDLRPDILIPCINGRYGNMDAKEAAQLTRDVRPALSIASHFWMFVAHNGNPGLFLDECSRLAPEVRAVVMTPGEALMFTPRQVNVTT